MTDIVNTKLKLMKGKALRKHNLHEKTAASVLLKLFISGNLNHVNKFKDARSVSLYPYNQSHILQNVKYN